MLILDRPNITNYLLFYLDWSHERVSTRAPEARPVRRALWYLTREVMTTKVVRMDHPILSYILSSIMAWTGFMRDET